MPIPTVSASPPDPASDQVPAQPDLLAQLEQERAARQQAESAAQAAAAEATRAQHITEIALRYKLPAELAKRLQGTTPAEIEADAKQLASSISLSALAGKGSGIGVSPGLVSDPAGSSRVTTLLDLVNGTHNPHPFRPADD